MSDTPPAPVADLLLDIARRVAWRGRTGLRKAMETSRSELERRQAERDLDHFWRRLGQQAHRLVHEGQVDHPDLVASVARIDGMRDRIDGREGLDDASGLATPDHPR